MSLLPWHTATRLARRKRSRGQALVELALMAPVMMALLLGTVDLGRLFYTYIGVNNAAREGAAFGAASPNCVTSTNCPDPNNITYHARQELSGDASLSVTRSCSIAGCPSSQGVSGPSGDVVTVRSTRVFNSLFGPSLTMAASASAVIP
ncbi:MAG: TadE family protein [Acidimicrobiales bacterium]